MGFESPLRLPAVPLRALETAYDYGLLDRFEVTGKTQFFQMPIQLQM